MCDATDDIQIMRNIFVNQPTTDGAKEVYLNEIADRLRKQDVDLRELQRMIKTLLVRWDKTCFSTILDLYTGDDSQSNVRKRTRIFPNMTASLLAISAHGKSVKYKEDARYVPPDRAVHGARKKVKFTKEEDAAILTGLGIYSLEQDKWVQIKLNAPEVLRNRTPVQLKDRVRILEKHFLIIEHAQPNIP